MTSVVYVDVLLTLNLMINFVIMAAAARLTGREVRPLFILGGSAIGAIGSLTIFFPYMGFWLSGLFKLALCSLMVLVAFRSSGLTAFLKNTFSVFLVSFVFAGLMLGIYIGLGPKGMLYFNGVVYFGVRPLSLLLLTAFSYTAVEVISRMTRRRQATDELCRMRIIMEGRSVTLLALFDTGNHLTEPFSGLPVVVCSYKDISAIAPEYILEYYNSVTANTRPGIRLVPFHTLKGRGALPSFRPERVYLSQGGKTLITNNLYVAVTLEDVGDELYSAIANPAVISYQFERVGEFV